MYSTARITSPIIMFSRRSNLSATAPASGPKISAGSSEVSQTPLTAYAPPLVPPSFTASVDSASRLSQSPRLDSDKAIHRRRNGVIDSTLDPRAPKGDLKFTAPGYRPGQGRVAHSAKLPPPWLTIRTGTGSFSLITTRRPGLPHGDSPPAIAVGEPAPAAAASRESYPAPPSCRAHPRPQPSS